MVVGLSDSQVSMSIKLLPKQASNTKIMNQAVAIIQCGDFYSGDAAPKSTSNFRDIREKEDECFCHLWQCSKVQVIEELRRISGKHPVVAWHKGFRSGPEAVEKGYCVAVGRPSR